MATEFNYSSGNVTENLTIQNEDNVMNSEYMENLERQLDETRFVVQKILMPMVILFGVIGNILNISVLTRRWMRSSTNHYLTALAFCDVLYLLFASTNLFEHYDVNIGNNKGYMTFKHILGIPFSNVFSNTGVCLTLTFTIERYIGVCHPMKGKRWCTPHRAKYIIAGVCLASVLLTFPCFFEKKIITQVTQDNEIRPDYVETTFGASDAYKVGYTFLTQTIFTFIPLCLLLVFNTMLIHAVTVASKKRQEMSGLTTSLANAQCDRQVRHQREQHKITIMLITVVMVFLICQVPQALLHIYMDYLLSGMPNQKVLIHLRILNNVANLLVMVNASINFVLYSSFSLKFRRTFRVLFCRCCQNRTPVHFIFSEVFSTVDTRNGNVTRTTKGTSSPYASSPMRHAHSYVSINVNVNLTPMASPTPSHKRVGGGGVGATTYYVNRSPCMSRNGCLAVNQMDKFV